VKISEVLALSETIFDNRQDFLRSLNRLVAKQLVETNTKTTDSVTGASHVRVTSAGWYYSTYLVRSFAYLDLVLQDTPLDDSRVEEALRAYVQQVDNLSDREDQKFERVEIRASRVRLFLRYLANEEERERKQFDLDRQGGIWEEPFVPAIAAQIESELTWILTR
jgi:hypothetical protein